MSQHQNHQQQQQQQQQILYHPHGTPLTRETFLAIFRVEDDNIDAELDVAECQAVLQQHPQWAAADREEEAPLHKYGDAVLPALLRGCDLRSPAGQSRKLGALNVVWKTLLTVLTGPRVSAATFAAGVRFMAGQVWYSVFSHDWADGRRNKTAAFCTSHLVSAVRSHPTLAVATSVGGVGDCGEGLGGELAQLFLAVAEAVGGGGGDGDAAAPEGAGARAQLLHDTVLLRLGNAIESIGAAAAQLDTAPLSAKGEQQQQQSEEAGSGGGGAAAAEGGAAACDASAGLLYQCCSDSLSSKGSGSSTSGAAAVGSFPGARSPSTLFLASSPSSAQHSPAPTTLTAAEAGSAAAVRAVAALGCLMRAWRGVLDSIAAAGGVRDPTRAALLQLVWETLLHVLPQALPPPPPQTRWGALMAAVRATACHLPAEVLWAEGAAGDAATPTSLRDEWVSCAAAALSLAVEAARPSAAAPALALLAAALTSPHGGNTSLLTESVVAAGKGLGGAASAGWVGLVAYLTQAGAAACAGAAQAALVAKEGAGAVEGAEAQAALWGYASALAGVVGASCAAALHTAPSVAFSATPRRRSSGGDRDKAEGTEALLHVDGGCFLALADTAFAAAREEMNIAADDVDSSDDGANTDRGAAAGVYGAERLSSCGDAVAIACHLDSILTAVIEGSSGDPQQATRLLQLVQLLRRLRLLLGGAGEGEREGEDGAASAAAATAAVNAVAAAHLSSRARRRDDAAASLSGRSTSPSPGAASAGDAFLAVVKAFSVQLSTLTRVLTVMAGKGGDATQLAAFVAASLLHEAAFLPLGEGQRDHVLGACIRRWVSLGFVVDPEGGMSGGDREGSSSSSSSSGDAPFGLPTGVVALLRHRAARALLFFVQHNTSLSVDQLRLPEVAAVALMRLLQQQQQGGEEGEGLENGSGTIGPGSGAGPVLTPSQRAALQSLRRHSGWARAVAFLRADLQPRITQRLASAAAASTDALLLAQLERSLVGCEEAMRRLLGTRTQPPPATPSPRAAADGVLVGGGGSSAPSSLPAAAATANRLEAVLAMGPAVAALLRGRRQRRRADDDEDPDDALVCAVAASSGGAVPPKVPRLEGGASGATDACGDGRKLVSAPSSSVQLLASSPPSQAADWEEVVSIE